MACYAGMATRRNIMAVLLLSGALAGLAGMSEVAGISHQLSRNLSRDDKLRAKWESKKRSLSRVKLLTYDDLLERAQRQLRTLSSLDTNR